MTYEFNALCLYAPSRNRTYNLMIKSFPIASRLISI
jgi:hypothetical protein